VLTGGRSSGPRDQDVARLDVAVDEPSRVSGVERVRHLTHDRRGASRLERTVLSEEVPQIGPLHVAHRDVEDTAHLARLVDRDDVRMLERGREP
jgi:hypothetical protein